MNVKELFDYKDGNLYWKKNGKRTGCLGAGGYLRTRFNNKLYYTHRLIFMLHNEYEPEFVDHIDGDKLNNKIENLREASREQNMQNRKLNNRNTSGIKGVEWFKRTESWRVNLWVKGKQKCFGYFKDKELAELVAVEARDKYHGEFANHG
jgi:hypothetical protein